MRLKILIIILLCCFHCNRLVLAEDNFTYKRVFDCIATGEFVELKNDKAIFKNIQIDNKTYTKKLNLKSQKTNINSISKGDKVKLYIEATTPFYFEQDINDVELWLVYCEKSNLDKSLAEKVKFIEATGLLDRNWLESEQWDLPVTRAETLAIFMDLYFDSNYLYTRIPYKDVSETHWARKYIGTAYEQGYIRGLTGSKFSPDEVIIYQDVLILLLTIGGKRGYNIETGSLYIQDEIQEMGGYPRGVLECAKKYKISDSSKNGTDIILRKDIINLLYQAIEHSTYFFKYGN